MTERPRMRHPPAKEHFDKLKEAMRAAAHGFPVKVVAQTIDYDTGAEFRLEGARWSVALVFLDVAGMMATSPEVATWWVQYQIRNAALREARRLHPPPEYRTS